MFFAQDYHTIGDLSRTRRNEKNLLKSLENFRMHLVFPFRNRYKGYFGCGAIRAVNLGGGGLLGSRRSRARYTATGLGAFTAESQPWRSCLLPLVIAKNSFCSFSVMGPRKPRPIWIRSIERTGVISTAVPEKNTSSAMYSISRGTI